MTQKLTDAQASVRNADRFRRDYMVLSQAGVGVVAVRTREPYRAVDVLKNHAMAEGISFHMWAISKGWMTYDHKKPNAAPVGDKTQEPSAALLKAGDDQFPERRIAVMMYLHKPLAQNIAMVQILKDYCRTFPESRKRLVLVVPPSWSAPEELVDDITVMDFDPPSYGELHEIFSSLVGMIKEEKKRPAFDREGLARVIAAGAGMTAHEFENAVARALVIHRSELPKVSADDFSRSILSVKIETVRRSEVLELMEPVGIENVGGLDNLKQYLQERSFCFSQEAKDFGLDSPKGVALIGPPGTGKSLVAKVTSSILGIPLVKLDVSRAFQGLVGASEARIREALKMAEAQAPCVLFIDEADKAFAGQANGQASGDSGVSLRLLGAILTFMQETTAPIYIMVTANRVAGLPPEFLRRGRLDEVFYVGLPDEAERLDIIKIHLAKRKQDVSKIKDLERVAERTAGFSPAELEAAVKDALVTAFVGKQKVTSDVLLKSLETIVPLSEAFKEQFEEMSAWARDNARPASSNAGSVPVRNRTRPTTEPAGREISLAAMDG